MKIGVSMALMFEPPQFIDKLQQNLNFQQHTPPADAAVLIAITQEENPQVLLTRRAEKMRQHAGEVSFPGGKRETGDTSNIGVALREAQEETALNPVDVQLLGELSMHQVRSGIQVKPIVGLIPAQVHLIAQPSEIDRIFFVPLTTFIDAQPQPYFVKYSGQEICMPCFQYDNEIVWGLTARIMISLLNQGLGYNKEWPFLFNMATSPR